MKRTVSFAIPALPYLMLCMRISSTQTFQNKLLFPSIHRTFTMGTGDPIHNGVSPFLLLAFTALLGGTVLVCVAALGVHVLRKANKAKTRSGGVSRLDFFI